MQQYVDPNKTNLIKKIDQEIDKKSLLKHKFYTLWNKGDLTIGNLRGYSLEYFQLVKSVPEFVQNIYNIASNDRHYISDPVLLKNIKQVQIEESEHIEPWMHFALSLGINKKELLEYNGTKKVKEAIKKLKRLSLSSLLNGSAAMYAFEKEIPLISTKKIDGLKKFYGICNEDAIKYFNIHETADIAHTRLWESIIADQNTNNDSNKKQEAPILNTVINSLQAQNQILDSVLETYVDTCSKC